jgi:gluconate 2-dehydrogenase gamma chain
VPSQGYQLPLTPAELYRAGIEASNLHCAKAYGKAFDQLAAAQKEDVLKGLESGTIVFGNGPPARVFFATVYQTVMEGMFADPVHGGNAGKAAWKMIGFPGVVATHTRNITAFKNKRYSEEPLGIADLS